MEMKSHASMVWLCNFPRGKVPLKDNTYPSSPSQLVDRLDTSPRGLHVAGHMTINLTCSGIVIAHWWPARVDRGRELSLSAMGRSVLLL